MHYAKYCVILFLGDIMNKFFTDNFNISKIHFCMCVKNGSGQLIHKNRPYHGLVYEIGGNKKYKFDDGTYINTYPGDVFYLPKFSNYEVVNIKKGDCVAVNFDLYDTDVTYGHFIISASSKEKYEKNFSALLSAWEKKPQGFLNKSYASLYSIICDIQKDMNKKYLPSPTKQTILKSIEYINANISDFNLTVQSISGYLNISPEYFRKLFSSVCDISPRKYIINERIKRAKILLDSKEFSIGQISRMCGYENESYFSHEFKRICGCSPSKYNNEDL